MFLINAPGDSPLLRDKNTRTIRGQDYNVYADDEAATIHYNPVTTSSGVNARGEGTTCSRPPPVVLN